jgi:hypothetical protein
MSMRSEVPKAVFWDVTSCSLVDLYQIFRGIYCLHLQDRRITWSCSPLLYLLGLQFDLEIEGSTFFLVIGKHLPDCTALHCRTRRFVTIFTKIRNKYFQSQFQTSPHFIICILILSCPPCINFMWSVLKTESKWKRYMLKLGRLWHEEVTNTGIRPPTLPRSVKGGITDSHSNTETAGVQTESQK